MSTSPKRAHGTVLFATALIGGLVLTGCAASGSDGNQAGNQGQQQEPAAPTASAESTAPTGALTVVVTEATHIVADQTIEVRAIVTGHIGDGTCKVVATDASGNTLTAEHAAVPDAQSTQCPLVVLDGAGEGEWQVVVTYEGEGVSGTSEATQAEVL